MENEILKSSETKKDYVLPASILISVIILAGTWVYTAGMNASAEQGTGLPKNSASPLEEQVLPSAGVLLPATWGDLGSKLVAAGAIDAEKFKAIYAERGEFTEAYEQLLLGKNNGKIKMTPDNAGYLLNLLWALGLASKNPVLDSGEMQDPKYGGAQNFASTAGWTIAKGSAMDHYSRHTFFDLTAEQQMLVDKVSRGVYRPCCGNSTHFPDCNHGMAMLGLLELMASQGVSEQNMWKAALAVNSYWFPDTYLTIATYMKTRGIDWKNVNPEEVLGANYSSSSGYAKIASEVVLPQQPRGGSGCGIGSAESTIPKRQQSGCGI